MPHPKCKNHFHFKIHRQPTTGPQFILKHLLIVHAVGRDCRLQKNHEIQMTQAANRGAFPNIYLGFSNFLNGFHITIEGKVNQKARYSARNRKADGCKDPQVMRLLANLQAS